MNCYSKIFKEMLNLLRWFRFHLFINEIEKNRHQYIGYRHEVNDAIINTFGNIGIFATFKYRPAHCALRLSKFGMQYQYRKNCYGNYLFHIKPSNYLPEFNVQEALKITFFQFT